MRCLPRTVAAALALLSATYLRPLSAEPREPREPPAEPLAMSSDRLELDAEARTAVLTGHVKLSRGPMSLSCPRVDLRYDQAPHVIWAKGSGGIVAEVKGVRAEAPEVELDLASRTLELRGGVRLTHGEGWLTAARASIDITTARVTMSEVKGSIPVPRAAPLP